MPRSTRTTRLFSLKLDCFEPSACSTVIRAPAPSGTGAEVIWTLRGSVTVDGRGHLAVAALGREGDAEQADLAGRMMIVRAGLGGGVREQRAVAADRVDGAGIPDIAYLVGGQHVRHQLRMVLVGMAEDQVVDPLELGRTALR